MSGLVQGGRPLCCGRFWSLSLKVRGPFVSLEKTVPRLENASRGAYCDTGTSKKRCARRRQPQESLGRYGAPAESRCSRCAPYGRCAFPDAFRFFGIHPMRGAARESAQRYHDLRSQMAVWSAAEAGHEPDMPIGQVAGG